ncbi:MAG TPA: dicarboxylate/amino acid:cation symporter [Kofleriaceae bacterium]|nr:dicarboxylate/amino acid:cation symporter [Kofleriaceae bacterium]
MGVGILAGAVLGLLASELVARGYVDAGAVGTVIEWVAYPVGQIFLRLLFMLAVPLIFSALVTGIAELDPRALGRIGLKTLGYTALVSALSVLLGLALVTVIGPGRGDNAELIQLAGELAKDRPPIAAAKGTGVTGVVSMIPTNPIAAAASGDMLGLIVFSLALGIGLAIVRTDNTARLRETIAGLNEVTMRLIAAVMRIAPLGVAGLLFASFATLGIDLLGKIAAYVGVVVLALALHTFGTYSLVLRLAAKRSPLAFFRDIRLALATAFATSSSSATLPTTLRVAEEELRLPRHVSRFVLTAGASMNQNGTALFEGVTVLFLAQVFGVDLTLAQSAVIMLICVLGGIGTAGIPGASLPVIAMMMAMYGIPAEGLALIVGVDRFLDMCRTTVNVAGDLVVAAAVAPGEELARDAVGGAAADQDA